MCASRRGSCLSQNRTSIRCLRPCGPSQKIEFVFSASPETIRREPLEFYLHRSVAYQQDLAVCALCNPVAFSLAGGGLSRLAAVTFCRHEVLLSPVDGEQPGHHLPSYRKRRPVGIPFLLFLFVDQC
jgi:hypothetical protein